MKISWNTVAQVTLGAYGTSSEFTMRSRQPSCGINTNDRELLWQRPHPNRPARVT